MREETTKHFNGERYYLHQGRWKRSSRKETPLSHDVWNHYHPEDKINSRDGFVIHHINENRSDDRIENLSKMTYKEHNGLHHSREKNFNWKEEISLDKKAYINEHHKEYSKKYRVSKLLFFVSDKDNHFHYEDTLVFNKKTGNIIITHSWGYY